MQLTTIHFTLSKEDIYYKIHPLVAGINDYWYKSLVHQIGLLCNNW